MRSEFEVEQCNSELLYESLNSPLNTLILSSQNFLLYGLFERTQ